MADVCTKCGTNLKELRDSERKSVRDLRIDKEQLERDLRALKKQLGRQDNHTGLSDHGYIRPLLSKLTDTFLTLEEAADPRRGAELSAQMRYRRADSTANEGASTRWARNLINEGLRDIRRWVNKVDAILEDSYQPPEKPPKARCGNRDCPAFDNVQTGRVGIPFTHCPACATPFSPGRIQNQPALQHEAST